MKKYTYKADGKLGYAVLDFDNSVVSWVPDETTAKEVVEELNSLLQNVVNTAYLNNQLATAHAAREAAEAKLDTLTNVLTSMVLGADSDTPIGEIQDRIKVWLEDKEALQAENARLLALLETYSRDYPQINPSLSASGYQWLIDKAQGYDTTPPATESARYGVTTSLGAPAVIRYSDNRIIRRFGAKGETLEQAKEYADELNANES